MFKSQLRRAALVWTCVSLPVNVAIAAVVVTTTDRYLVVFALLASGAYTTPALLFTYLAARRAPRPDNRCWWVWLVAVALMYAIGCAMLVGAATGAGVSVAVSAITVAVTALLLMTVVVCVVRTRSGRRAVSVDLLESVMSVLVVAAPSAIIWGDDVVSSDGSWFAVPAALAAVAMVFGVYWAILLCLRLRGDPAAPAGSATIGLVAVLLAGVGLVNAVAQTAQGVTGFELPAAPLLALHGLCMSLLMLVPLYVPDTISPGLDRLPPQDQVRGAWLPAVLLLVGLPHLVGVAVFEQDTEPNAPLYSLTAVSVVLVLAALRQLAAGRETRRLYAEVERAAEARRELLAALMQRTDDDRHRVAAQLHEQAVSAYASFVSFVQMSTVGQRAAGPVAGASAMVRDELRSQAESLRLLMMAVQPLEVDRPRSTSLSTPIHAYVDGLYRDGRRPSQRVTVADDLELDWATETLVLRIVQEAVRNIWRHSRAEHIDVVVRADGPVVELSVTDDGVGFDPERVMFESGIRAMRSFAELGQGAVVIDSAPGRGTTVTARLGDAPPAAADGGGRRVRGSRRRRWPPCAPAAAGAPGAVSRRTVRWRTRRSPATPSRHRPDR